MTSTTDMFKISDEIYTASTQISITLINDLSSIYTGSSKQINCKTCKAI